MGCGSTHIIGNFFEQTKSINLSKTKNFKKLKHAQNLISLKIKIKKRIVFIYHKLTY